MMALKIAYAKNTITKDRYLQLMNDLYAVPEKVKEILKDTSNIKAIAEKYKDAKDFCS
jgi:glucosamine--fructose-6-phosphate aminotransferase (isomerizing)